MTRLRLRLPESDAVLTETLPAGEALLVGRDPDLARLAALGIAAPVARVRPLAVAAPTVSSLHLLVWNDGERLCVRDLGSRNGTRFQLPPSEDVTLGAAEELSVDLAPVAEAPDVHRAPRDAEWTDPAGFPDAVAHALNRWFAAGRSALKATATREPSTAGAPHLPPIPLVDDWKILLAVPRGEGTIDPLWGAVMQTVVEYVHDQRAAFAAERDGGHDASFVLESPVFREAHRKVVEAAARGLQLILLGPTGAGKGTLARCYHLHSGRRGGAFETVNCAEIDKHFARTRLFGAKKGAYTGCAADIAGAVECARGGTLFLDELAELPLDVQGELLTFLDDQRYKRMGDDQWRQADVRVVCGTNGDLREAVRDGKFRADLWYRLAGRVVEIPPLRERPEDVAAFLRARTLGESRDAVSAWEALDPAARARVRAHPWRGNFRELDGFVRRLNPGARPGSIDDHACREALREGTLEVGGEARRAVEAAGGWQGVLLRASEVFQQKHPGGAPTKTSEFKDYVEDTLKPLFFAHTLGFESLDELPERPTPSYEELGRRLGCDGATVKSQLARYLAIKRAWLKSAP
jgi:DNA-binding NtrC family response regulator